MLSELFFIVMAIGLSLIVLRYYLARNNGEQKDEEETSLKDMMLTGVQHRLSKKRKRMTRTPRNHFGKMFTQAKAHSLNICAI